MHSKEIIIFDAVRDNHGKSIPINKMISLFKKIQLTKKISPQPVLKG